MRILGRIHAGFIVVIPFLSLDSRKATQVNAALDRRPGIRCISSELAAKLADHVGGLQETFPFEGWYSAQVADAHQVPIA